MIYTNNNIRIVPFERSRHMTETYRGWFHDPDVTRFNSHGLFPYTAATMEEFVTTIEKGSSSKIVWAIEAKSDSKPFGDSTETMAAISRWSPWRHIGNCSLQSINYINRSAELAVVIGDGRGKGIGTQVCQWMITHGFLRLGISRIWTGTAETNMGMRRVCEKLGMKHEGTFRNGVFLDGEFVDVFSYGILFLEWKEK